MKEKMHEFKAKCFYTLGTIVLILSLIPILVACDQNKFEFQTYIEPELTLVSGNIAVEYKLGDLLILDEWPSLNAGQAIFLLNKEKEKTFHLRVVAGDFAGVKFYYSITGAIEVQTSPVDCKIMGRNVDSFPNVIWSVKDGKTIEKEEQKIVEKEGQKSAESLPDSTKKLGNSLLYLSSPYSIPFKGFILSPSS